MKWREIGVCWWKWKRETRVPPENPSLSTTILPEIEPGPRGCKTNALAMTHRRGSHHPHDHLQERAVTCIVEEAWSQEGRDRFHFCYERWKIEYVYLRRICTFRVMRLSFKRMRKFLLLWKAVIRYINKRRLYRSSISSALLIKETSVRYSTESYNYDGQSFFFSSN